MTKKLVGERGFEPPAPASRRQCSTRLSYSPTDSGIACNAAGQAGSIEGAFRTGKRLAMLFLTWSEQARGAKAELVAAAANDVIGELHFERP